MSKHQLKDVKYNLESKISMRDLITSRGRFSCCNGSRDFFLMFTMKIVGVRKREREKEIISCLHYHIAMDRLKATYSMIILCIGLWTYN